MNNDTFYNGIVLDLSDGPIHLGTEAADDRNANYANIIQPKGEYTFYYGENLRTLLEQQ